MEDFDRFVAQGQKLGFSGDKLADYVSQCEERALRVSERERKRKKKKN